MRRFTSTVGERAEKYPEGLSSAGIARSSFYEIEKAYEQFGRNILVSTRGGWLAL